MTRVRTWWWRTGLSGLALVLVIWRYDFASLGWIDVGMVSLIGGLLMGAVIIKRPGDIDPSCTAEKDE